MDAEKLQQLRKLLLDQLKKHSYNVQTEQAAALAAADDGVKDAVDMSLMDVNKEISLRLGEHQSQMIADINQALLRMDEGSYGVCGMCEEPINERRLGVVPTARYCAPCQSAAESAAESAGETADE
jgi:DnaK suppressor protein